MKTGLHLKKQVISLTNIWEIAANQYKFLLNICLKQF